MSPVKSRDEVKPGPVLILLRIDVSSHFYVSEGKKVLH